jgi:hypothetical protein
MPTTMATPVRLFIAAVGAGLLIYGGAHIADTNANDIAATADAENTTAQSAAQQTVAYTSATMAADLDNLRTEGEIAGIVGGAWFFFAVYMRGRRDQTDARIIALLESIEAQGRSGIS